MTKTPAAIADDINLDAEWFALNDDHASIQQELKRIIVEAIEVDRAQQQGELTTPNDTVSALRSPETIAEETAGAVFGTYDDSAEEVGHPEGQPIVETWPALRASIVDGINADRAQLRVALVSSNAIPGFRDFPLAPVDELIEAYLEFTGPDETTFIDAWNDFTAGKDFPCPEHPAGLHQITDGSCDLCGDKNRS